MGNVTFLQAIQHTTTLVNHPSSSNLKTKLIEEMEYRCDVYNALTNLEFLQLQDITITSSFCYGSSENSERVEDNIQLAMMSIIEKVCIANIQSERCMNYLQET